MTLVAINGMINEDYLHHLQWVDFAVKPGFFIVIWGILTSQC